MKIGIYSGTFDPVHLGHISFAKLAKNVAGLEKVVFIPEHEPRGKHSASSLTHRAKMLELALKDEPLFEVMSLEDKTMTLVSSLPKIQNKYPGARLVLLLGSDVFYTLHLWEGLAKVAEEIGFLVGVRGSMPLTLLEDARRKAEFAASKLLDVQFTSPNQDHISSTKVRRGELKHTLPSVRDYIAAQSLY